MRVSVFGLGYVGCVSAACLAERGNEVIGVDVSPDKVDDGPARPGAGRRGAHRRAHRRGRRAPARLRVDRRRGRGAWPRATSRWSASARPSARQRRASRRSTWSGSPRRSARPSRRSSAAATPSCSAARCCPAPARTLLDPASSSAASGLRAGRRLRRLRSTPSSCARAPRVARLLRPAQDGRSAQVDAASGDAARGALRGPARRRSSACRSQVAEMTKYVDNAFHALKVGFANEIGAICQALGVDSHAVMEIFCVRHASSTSRRAYLQPGLRLRRLVPAQGPARARLPRARRADVSVPILENVLPSNEAHLRRVYDAARGAPASAGSALLGLAFKPGTDDLRESPMVELAERLLGQGLRPAHPRRARRASRTCTGANRAYVDARIPHLIAQLMVATPMAAVLDHAEVVRASASTRARRRSTAVGRRATAALLVDLVRLPGAGRARERLTRRGLVSGGWHGARPDPRREPLGARSTGGSGRRAARSPRPATRSR